MWSGLAIFGLPVEYAQQAFQSAPARLERGKFGLAPTVAVLQFDEPLTLV